MSDRRAKDHDSDLEENREDVLNRIRSSGTVMMSPELFEKLYLQPISSVKGDLRKTFANPTPLGLLGFVLGLTPLACNLIGWRGSGGLGAANIAIYYFIGGPLCFLCGILEFFLGNTFTFAVFSAYGGIFLALAGSLHPFFGSASAYSPTGSFAEGLKEPAFNASLAFFPIGVGCMNAFFCICATKINLVFLLIFAGSGLGFTLLGSALWAIAEGATVASGKLLVATGSVWFFSAMLGWYLLLIQLLGIMDFQVNLPVGDFSRFWNRRERAKAA